MSDVTLSYATLSYATLSCTTKFRSEDKKIPCNFWLQGKVAGKKLRESYFFFPALDLARKALSCASRLKAF